MFYNIPTIQNMIAAQQLSFLGKVVRGPHDAPPHRILTACYQHKCKPGRPYLHNKDIIVCNLRLLFARTPKIVIDDYGSVKDWFREASHELYWTQLVQCLLDEQAPLPMCPTTWLPPQRRSPRTHMPTPPPNPPDGPGGDHNNSNPDSPPIPSPPH